MNTFLSDLQTCQNSREALKVIRQLETERAQHIRLLLAYQRQFADSHWVVRYLLDSIIERSNESRISANRLQSSLLKSLHGNDDRLSRYVKQQRGILCLQTRAMLDVEEKVLLRMLDLLIHSPVPRVQSYRLRLVKQ